MPPSRLSKLGDLKERVSQSAKKHYALKGATTTTTTATLANNNAPTGTSRWQQTPRSMRRGEMVQANNVRNVVHAQGKVVDALMRENKWDEAKVSLEGLVQELPEACETSGFWLALSAVEEQRTGKDRETMLNLLNIALQHVPGALDRVQLLEATSQYLSNPARKDLPTTLEAVFLATNEVRKLSFATSSPMRFGPPRELSPRPSPMTTKTLVATAPPLSPPAPPPAAALAAPKPMVMSVSKLPTPKFDDDDDDGDWQPAQYDDDEQHPQPPVVEHQHVESRPTTTTSSTATNVVLPTSTTPRGGSNGVFQTLLGSPALRVRPSSRSMFLEEFLDKQNSNDDDNHEEEENSKPPPLLTKSPRLVKKVESIMKEATQPVQQQQQPVAGGSRVVFAAVRDGRGQKVATPVRRSSRPSSNGTVDDTTLSIHRVLEEARYSYAPNPSLARML